jgi:gluconolactonase
MGDVDPNRPTWLAYDVKEDGTITNGRVFFDATAWTTTRPGAPDGLKTDKGGNLFASGPGGLSVFAPDGIHLGSIELGVATANCAWGEDAQCGTLLPVRQSTAFN